MTGKSIYLTFSTAIVAVAVSIFLPQFAVAETLDDIYRVAQAGTSDAQASQRRVDSLHDQTQATFREYRQVLKEVEGLKVYNARLENQIADQERRIAQIDASIRQAVVVQRQIPGLATRMIDALEELIRLDMPFYPEERAERIQLLRLNQDRSDVSTAEKFRQVLEAYKIENEYGRKIDSYRDTVEIDGAAREVNILRIGRIAMMYQTTDGALTGAWNRGRGDWDPLTGRAYRASVLQGLRISRKQAAIQLMRVPIAAPEAL